jgi:cytochrome c-type biogenesis protein CcmH
MFFFIAGVLAICALLPLLSSLVRSDAAGPAPRRTRALGITAVAVVLGTALVLYAWLGSPPEGTAPVHPVSGEASSSAPGSMEEATARLATRLAASGGTAADWELLAKAYEFLGRAGDARAARLKEAAAGASDSPAVATLAATPSPPSLDTAAMRDLAKADKLRRARDYAGACRIYAQLAQRGLLTSAAWADYADAAGSRQGGSLKGEPGRYIDEALRLDPKQPKALWLRASLEHEQHRESQALADWRELARVLPPDSPDQRIVAANIAEAERIGGVLPAPPEARIVGTVELARSLAPQVPPGATLFIYAKEPGAAGPPLAVLRVRADHWPVEFALDDDNAMIPGRTLSGASSVQLEARISRSGEALPQAGDFVGTAAEVDPRAGHPVRIPIDHTIG